MRGRCAALVILSVSQQACGRGGLPIGELGYQELRPPTSLVPPGTIVVLRHVDPIEVAIVCTQEEVVDGRAIVRSPTKSLVFARKTSVSFNVGADYLRAFGVDVQASHVRDVFLTLSKAEVWEIPDSAVVTSLPSVSADCKKAVDLRLHHSRTVGLVKSVLKADVMYTVNIDDTLSAAIRAALLTDLALKLGGSVSSTSSSQITGEGLFWGILTDTDFFSARGRPPTAAMGRLVLIPGGAPITRVEAKGSDLEDYR